MQHEDFEKEKIERQKKLEKEIEEQGIKYGWKSIGVNNKGNGKSLKDFDIVKYKNSKVARNENGNMMFCEKGNCYNQTSEGTTLCNIHRKNPNHITYEYCQLGELCIKTASLGYEHKKPIACKNHAEPEMGNVKQKCSVEGCKTYGGKKNKITGKYYCPAHADEDCVDTHPRCLFPGCGDRGRDGLIEKVFCKKHEYTKFEDINIAVCLEQDCGKRAKYGYNGKKEYCAEHADWDMRNGGRICTESGCKSGLVYGFEGERATKCSSHKLPGMRNLSSRKCQDTGCNKTASFGFEGEKAAFCDFHKLPGMKNVNSKKCQENNCRKSPNFGFFEGKPLFCKTHAPPAMKDVIHKKCEFDGCDTRATFASPGKKIFFCDKHKSDDAIPIEKKCCEIENCKKVASYGTTKKDLTRCCKHFTPDMIRNERAKMCETEGCKKVAYRGSMYSNKNIHCQDHSTNNEYTDRKRKPVCKHLGCFRIAKFVIKTQNDKILTPTHCESHRDIHDIEMIQKPCSGCNQTFYTPYIFDTCAQCGDYKYHRNPEKFKEKKLKQFLTDNGIEYVHNKTLLGNNLICYPDFIIESKFGFVVLECDEHMHHKYSKSDEIIRMRNIYHLLQKVRPNSQVLFLRYNPDGYRGGKTETGERLKSLLNLIHEYMIKEILYVDLGAIYMYYTNFNGSFEVKDIGVRD